jgi:hypothetical protein
MPSKQVCTVTIANRVIKILETHRTDAWLVTTGLSINLGTDFRELMFDHVDESLVSRQLEESFDIPLPPSLPWPKTVGNLIAVVDRRLLREQRLAIIRRFFTHTWQPFTNNYVLSGKALVERIKQLEPKQILDVGCGYNEYKDDLPGLIGLDIANARADVVTDFLRYDPGDKLFDVILALGSINFGSAESILDELRHACSMLAENGRIFMRVNPGIPWVECPELEIYPWSHEAIHLHGAELGLEVDGNIGEDKGKNGPRLVFVYRRRRR